MRTQRVFGLALAFTLGACGGAGPARRGPAKPTVATGAGVGSCADPRATGVVSDSPEFVRYDADLDGDGKDEIVIADENACTPEGNCHWNLFVEDGEGGCTRYVGTIGGEAMQRLEALSSRSGAFYDVRAAWRLSGQRLLLQTYRFRHGGYRVVDALLCRRGDDDRLLCADDELDGEL